MFFQVDGSIGSFPYHCRNEIPLPKHIIEEALDVGLVAVVDGAEDDAAVAQQLPRQHQARVQHREQVVARDGVLIVRLGKLPHAVFAIRRVDIDDVHLPAVLDEQILKGVQVVADNQAVGGLVVAERERLVAAQVVDLRRGALEPLVEMEARAFVGGAERGNHHRLVVVDGLHNEPLQQGGIGGFKNVVGHPPLKVGHQLFACLVHGAARFTVRF